MISVSLLALSLLGQANSTASSWKSQLAPIVASMTPAVKPVVRTRTIYIRVPRRLREPEVRVNGLPTGLDAVLRNDRVYVAVSQLPALLEPYGLYSVAEYSPETNTLDWRITPNSRARPGTFAAGLEALWRGDVQAARAQLTKVEGDDRSQADALLETIRSLREVGPDLGVVRFVWSMSPRKVKVFVEETEIPAGSLLMVVPSGTRAVSFYQDGGPVFTGRIQVRPDRATVVVIDRA